MPPSLGAAEVMSWVRATYPSLRVVAITACGAGDMTRARRIDNLERHFRIDEIVTLPLGASKVDEFRKLPKGAIFVDDMIKHVKAADECGLSPILFRRGHNSQHTFDRVADDWWRCRDLISGLIAAPSPRPIVLGAA
jgi:hypothetical protein